MKGSFPIYFSELWTCPANCSLFKNYHSDSNGPIFAQRPFSYKPSPRMMLSSFRYFTPITQSTPKDGSIFSSIAPIFKTNPTSSLSLQTSWFEDLIVLESQDVASHIHHSPALDLQATVENSMKIDPKFHLNLASLTLNYRYEDFGFQISTFLKDQPLNQIDTRRKHEIGGGISLCYRYTKNLSVGGETKLIQNKIDFEHSTSLISSIGLIYAIDNFSHFTCQTNSISEFEAQLSTKRTFGNIFINFIHSPNREDLSPLSFTFEKKQFLDFSSLDSNLKTTSSKFQLGAKSGGNLSSLFEVALDHLKISVGFKSEFNVYSGNWKFGIHLSSKTKDQKITFQTF